MALPKVSLFPWSIPRSGRAWLLTVALLLLIGIGRNINLLALLGYALLAIFVINALIAGRRLRRLRVTRRLGDSLHAGSPIAVELRVECTTSRGIGGSRLEDVGPEHRLAWYLEGVAGRGRQVCRGQVILPRRGPYEWGPILGIAGNPFGLFRRRVILTPGETVIVLPRVGQVQRDLLRRRLRGADPRGERLRRQGWRHLAARADIHGVRPFRPGDSPRWVHWRTTARRGELMVREFEDVPGEDLAVILDPCGEDGPLFEIAVSLAASVCHEWCRKRGDRLILALANEKSLILDGVTAPEHGRTLLEALAVVQPGSLTPDAAVKAIAALPPSVAVMIVSTGDSPLARMFHRPVTHARADALPRLDWYVPPGDGPWPMIAPYNE